MRPKKHRTMGASDLFRARLDQIINMKHELVQLSGKIDWNWIDGEIAPLYSENGRPGIETRFMIGLLLLKHIYGLSDDPTIYKDPAFAATIEQHKSEITRFDDPPVLSAPRSGRGLRRAVMIDKGKPSDKTADNASRLMAGKSTGRIGAFAPASLRAKGLSFIDSGSTRACRARRWAQSITSLDHFTCGNVSY